MANFETVGLWQRAFGTTGQLRDDDARARLSASYRRFWSNAITLSNQIQKSVPGLTLHDERHFDALWARADQIAGTDITLNPLELFVLGGAILVHDNANSIAAFPGGMAEVATTPEWADAEANWREKEDDRALPAELPEAARDVILFDTLRAIHARRAETLTELELEVDGSRVRLLEDDNLRRHLGELIGKIAASHHWDVLSLPSQLQKRQGALADMPDSWSIRPILLALLLRCADAVQLDQSRTPDFLFGLLRLRGVSRDHWLAQNRLSTPTIDPLDPGALLFTSTRTFDSDVADAWWIAFEALQMANGELQAADAMLRDFQLPPFAVRRIRGADSPLRLAEHVRVSGWQPVPAEVKITDVAKVVGTFGGQQLYGNDYSVPLRELVQNAADAVRLRRRLEPKNSGYEGRILVKLTAYGTGRHSLIVEDDGIGMSPAVLVGPLIDFGGSYLSSVIVQQEHPGLRASAPRRIGKYGIGFFSSFMLSEEIHVSSKPFDKGIDAVRTLVFRKGIFDRPLLMEQRPADFGSMLSTRVQLLISDEKLQQMLQFPGWSGNSTHPISVEQLVGLLCPMLDVDIAVDSGSDAVLLHKRKWFEEDRREWLERILIPEGSGNPFIADAIAKHADRLRFINPENPSDGLAAILTGSAGTKTVGTLRSPMLFNKYADDFIGTLEYDPGGPKRDAGKPRAKEQMARWASEQALLIAAKAPPFPERQSYAERVCQFGGNATPLFGMPFNGEWIDLDEIVAKLISGIILIAPLKVGAHGEAQLARVRERHSGYLDNYRKGELKYRVPTLEATDSSQDKIYVVPTEDRADDVSFFGIIGRHAASRGYSFQIEGVERVDFAEYVGEASPREGLLPGKRIITSGLKMWVEPRVTSV